MSVEDEPEAYQQLLKDEDFHHVVTNVIPELDKQIDEFKPRRKHVLEQLKDNKEAIEVSYDRRTKAKVAGASAAAAGSTIAIVGFGLSFVTFGASLGLTIAGGVIAGVGAVTMGGADFIDFIVAQVIKSGAKKAIQHDREISEKIRVSAMDISERIDKLALRYPQLDKGKIWEAAVSVSKAVTAGKILYDGYRAIDTAFDIGRLAFKAGRFATVGTASAQIAFAGLNTVAGGLSIAGCVFDVIAIPFDIIVIIKGAYDIHKYRTGRGSNSRAAKRIGEMIKALENHYTEVMKIKECINQSDSEEE